MSRLFLLGLGARNAGTTRIGEYLIEQSGVNFGFGKEYGVFNALHLPEYGDEDTDLIKRARLLLEELKSNIDEKDIAELIQSTAWIRLPQQSKMRETDPTTPSRGRTDAGETALSVLIDLKKTIYRLNMIRNNASYYAYFNDLLRDECTLTGDLTPEYAGLSEGALTKIKQEFGQRRIEVKPIFLMRDPVYRLQAAVRAELGKRKPGKRKSGPTERVELDMMRKSHLDRFDLLQSGYDKMLARLFDVFGRDGCYVDVYETMFDDTIATRLGRFLGMELSPAPLDGSAEKPARVSGTDHALTRDEYMSFRAGYAETIAAVEKMGFSEVGDLWQWSGVE